MDGIDVFVFFLCCNRFRSGCFLWEIHQFADNKMSVDKYFAKKKKKHKSKIRKLSCDVERKCGGVRMKKARLINSCSSC